MARTRVRWGRVAVLGAVLSGTLWVGGRALGGSEGPVGGPPDRLHVVRQGETLWEIARLLIEPEDDPRPAVEAIRRSNGLRGSAILEGQTLVLPAL